MSAIDRFFSLYDDDAGQINECRAELAQLRDTVTRLDAQVAEQARQLEQACKVIKAYRRLPTGPKGYTSMPLFDLHNNADDWLAANSPQDQEQAE